MVRWGAAAVIKGGVVRTAASIDKAAIGFDMQGGWSRSSVARCA